MKDFGNVKRVITFHSLQGLEVAISYNRSPTCLQISLMTPLHRHLSKHQGQCPKIKWMTSEQKQVYTGNTLVEGKANAGSESY